ncbi:MAG: DUF5009 domain-containing protein [Alistipes sp.]|nr:DUF5009 domain-containing protein [Alistipes sp.]
MKKMTRVATIDVFRALTMFFMLFVNDVPSAKNIPHWIQHAEWNEDMLGFADTIFPLFIFAMGMSIPFAILNRERRGDSSLKIGLHIILRTIALIVMGLFLVNMESYDWGGAIIPYRWYMIMLISAFFLLWNDYPRIEGKKRHIFTALKVAGVALLCVLFHYYRGDDGAPFARHWWGILGLIGWCYFVTAVVFSLVRDRLVPMTIAWVAAIAASLLTHSHMIDLSVIPVDMTLHALGISGAFTSVMIMKVADKERPAKFIALMLGLAAVMLALMFWAHDHWIISKIRSTPTWLFACNAIAFTLVAILYYLTDVKGKKAWFDIIKPAGVATLTCYMIPYLWYAIQGLLGWHYPEICRTGMGGIIKSLVFSLIVVWIAGGMSKARIRMKI